LDIKIEWRTIETYFSTLTWRKTIKIPLRGTSLKTSGFKKTMNVENHGKLLLRKENIQNKFPLKQFPHFRNVFLNFWKSKIHCISRFSLSLKQAFRGTRRMIFSIAKWKNQRNFFFVIEISRGNLKFFVKKISDSKWKFFLIKSWGKILWKSSKSKNWEKM
jgi:hypothetical protein